MRHARADGVAEQLTGQVRHGAVATGGKEHLAGIFFHHVHQLRHIGHTKRCIHHQNVGHAHAERHWREVSEEVERHIFLQTGRDGIGVAGHEQRVAVGRRLGHLHCGNAGAGTGSVFHQHALTKELAHLVGQDA